MSKQRWMKTVRWTTPATAPAEKQPYSGQKSIQWRRPLIHAVLCTLPLDKAVAYLHEDLRKNGIKDKPNREFVHKLLEETRAHMGLPTYNAFFQQKTQTPEGFTEYHREHCVNWALKNQGMPREEQLSNPKWDFKPSIPTDGNPFNQIQLFPADDRSGNLVVRKSEKVERPQPAETPPPKGTPLNIEPEPDEEKEHRQLIHQIPAWVRKLTRKNIHKEKTDIWQYRKLLSFLILNGWETEKILKFLIHSQYKAFRGDQKPLRYKIYNWTSLVIESLKLPMISTLKEESRHSTGFAEALRRWNEINTFPQNEESFLTWQIQRPDYSDLDFKVETLSKEEEPKIENTEETAVATSPTSATQPFLTKTATTMPEPQKPAGIRFKTKAELEAATTNQETEVQPLDPEPILANSIPAENTGMPTVTEPVTEQTTTAMKKANKIIQEPWPQNVPAAIIPTATPSAGQSLQQQYEPYLTYSVYNLWTAEEAYALLETLLLKQARKTEINFAQFKSWMARVEYDLECPSPFNKEQSESHQFRNEFLNWIRENPNPFIQETAASSAAKEVIMEALTSEPLTPKAAVPAQVTKPKAAPTPKPVPAAITNNDDGPVITPELLQREIAKSNLQPTPECLDTDMLQKAEIPFNQLPEETPDEEDILEKTDSPETEEEKTTGLTEDQPEGLNAYNHVPWPKIKKDQFNQATAENQYRILERIHILAIIYQIPSEIVLKFLISRKLVLKRRKSRSFKSTIEQNINITRTTEKFHLPVISGNVERFKPYFLVGINEWLAVNTIPALQGEFVSWKPNKPKYTIFKKAKKEAKSEAGFTPANIPLTTPVIVPPAGTIPATVTPQPDQIPESNDSVTEIPQQPLIEDPEAAPQTSTETPIPDIGDSIPKVDTSSPKPASETKLPEAKSFFGFWTITSSTQNPEDKTSSIISQTSDAEGNKTWTIKLFGKTHTIQRKNIKRNPATEDQETLEQLLEQIRNAGDEKFEVSKSLLIFAKTRDWTTEATAKVLIPVLIPELDPASQEAVNLTSKGFEALELN
jgi:hypothetical protein